MVIQPWPASIVLNHTLAQALDAMPEAGLYAAFSVYLFLGFLADLPGIRMLVY